MQIVVSQKGIEYTYTRDALCAAAEKGAVETVRFLIEEGVSKHDADKDGWTPLLCAVWKTT